MNRLMARSHSSQGETQNLLSWVLPTWRPSYVLLQQEFFNLTSGLVTVWKNARGSEDLRNSTLSSLSLPRRHAQRSCKGYNQVLWKYEHGGCVLCAVDKNQGEAETELQQSDASIDELEARLGVGRRARRGGASETTNVKSAPIRKEKPKDWETMALPEKMWALYIGEKGILFWLNKLAYASIYGIIGGWIVFRFIGPALGWYELESGLLPPSQLLAGSGGR